MVESNQKSGGRPRFHAATVSLRRLTELGRAFEAHLERHLAVNPTDREAMEHLISRGPLTPSQLSRAIRHSPAGTTTVIDRLERLGHITREPDPTDRRKTWITATDSSKEEAEQLLRNLARTIDDVAQGLSREEQETVTRYLDMVTERYETLLSSSDPE